MHEFPDQPGAQRAETRSRWMRFDSPHGLVLVIVLTALAVAVTYREAQRARRRANESYIASSLRMVANALADHFESRGSYPARVNYDDNGMPATSWRLAIFEAFGAPRPTGKNVRIPWNEEPNIPYASAPHALFCIGGAKGATDATVFALDYPGAIYGKAAPAPHEWPNDLALAVWTDQFSGLNWTAPGDICVNPGGDSCHATSQDLPDDFRVFVIFADWQVWECRGREGCDCLFPFADLEYAAANDRDGMARACSSTTRRVK